MMLPSITNRFNGNLCFGAASDGGLFIVECIRSGGTFSYGFSPSEVTGISDIGPRTYLVCYADTYVGRLNNGSFDSTYNDISPYYAHDIQAATSGDYYVLDKDTGVIIKYVNDVLVWTFSVGSAVASSILLRESENTIIYYDRSNTYTIRDDGTTAKMVASVHVGSGIQTSMVGSSNYMPRHVFGRAKQVDSGTFMSSSSSSSSSVGTSSSSSSSSSSQ